MTPAPDVAGRLVRQETKRERERAEHGDGIGSGDGKAEEGEISSPDRKRMRREVSRDIVPVPASGRRPCADAWLQDEPASGRREAEVMGAGARGQE
jgi:hypothetical protein